MLPEDFHQVSAEEYLWFGRCWLKNSKMAAYIVLGNLWYANGMILAVSKPPCCTKPSTKFLLKRIYGLEEDIS